MTISTVRADLMAALEPLTPKRWRWIPYSANVDVLDRPTVMLKLSTITRTPSAPQSGHTAAFTLTIVEPKVTDLAGREDSLDDNLLDLIHALDKVPGLTWTKAERVLFADTNLAYDITLETLSTSK